ncbi:hypothetical protein JCM8547_001323 [Rhodosporidiobolus lusitaniae]
MNASSSSSASPSALPSHLLHLATLVLLSRSSASSSSSSETGFTHARTLPLHTLSHLFTEYLHLAASSAARSATQAGRTQASVWDVADALGELGFKGKDGVDELVDEARRGHEGVEEEAEQLSELAKGLQDHLAPSPLQPPIAQLTYDPLHPSELQLLDLAASLPSADAPTPSAASSDSSSDDEDAESELASPPPVIPGTGGTVHALPEATEEAALVKQEPGLEEGEGAAGGLGSLGAFGFDGLDGLDSLSDLGLLTGGNAADAAFFDSLGLGAPPDGGTGAAALNGTAGALNGIDGIGDLPVSIFQPLDLAGRPMDGLEMLAPAGVNGLGPSGEDEEEDEEDARPFPAWRDASQIPDWVPAHLPPFPGQERESDSTLARRRRREREKERERLELAAAAHANSTTVGRAAAALMLGGGAAGDPWEEAIPYSASSLATMAVEFPNSLPTPSSPHGKEKELSNGGGKGGEGKEGESEEKKRARKRRRRSLSPPPTASTSLSTFAQIQPLIPHPPSLLRASQLRRTAASYISHQPRHPELAISSDSLFGTLPYAVPLRQSTLPPGFLPDTATTSALHPFNTNLPYTISTPVPYHPSSSSSLLPAPPPNARIPSSLSSIARELSFPLQFDTREGKKDQLHPNIALFSRLRRIGPPGPLGAKGEALNYEYIGNTALLQLSGVDWMERRLEGKLPRKGGAGEDEEEGAKKAGGIKLKLGGGRGGGEAGRLTRENSLAVGTPWGGVGSPATGATPGPSTTVQGYNATPGPSGLGSSSIPTSISTQPLPPSTITSSSTFDVSALLASTSLPPLTSSLTSLPSLSSATPLDPSFDYPDFLLSAGGLEAALTTAGLENGGINGFDWAGLGAGLGAGLEGLGGVGGGGEGGGGEGGGVVSAVQEGGAEAAVGGGDEGGRGAGGETGAGAGRDGDAEMATLDPTLSSSSSSTAAPSNPPPPPPPAPSSVTPAPAPAPALPSVKIKIGGRLVPPPPPPPAPAPTPAPASTTETNGTEQGQGGAGQGGGGGGVVGGAGGGVVGGAGAAPGGGV